MEEVVLDGTGEDMLLRWLFGREVSETDGGREGLIVFLWFLQCTRVLCLVHHFLWSCGPRKIRWLWLGGAPVPAVPLLKMWREWEWIKDLLRHL